MNSETNTSGICPRPFATKRRRRLNSAVLLSACVAGIVTGCPSTTCGQVQDLICPPNSDFAQPPQLGGTDWDAYVSDWMPYHIRYEKFEGLGGSICGIRWWGLSGYDTGSGFVECVEDPMSFRITFYQDSLGQPGDAVCSYVVASPATVVAEVNGLNLNLYGATLDSCCVLMNGWISIVGFGGDPSCWFMWNSSWAGDVSSCRRDAGGLTCGLGERFRDLSLCLMDSPVQTSTTTWGRVKSLYR